MPTTYIYRIYETKFSGINIIAVDVYYNGEWFRDEFFALDGSDKIGYFTDYITAIALFATFEFPTNVDDSKIRSSEAIYDMD